MTRPTLTVIAFAAGLTLAACEKKVEPPLTTTAATTGTVDAVMDRPPTQGLAEPAPAEPVAAPAAAPATAP